MSNDGEGGRGGRIFRVLRPWSVLLLALASTVILAWLFSVWLSYLFGVWAAVIHAVALPVMVGAVVYYLAPAQRKWLALALAVIGLGAAVWYWCPSYYPAWHPLAHQRSDAPILLFCGSTLTVLVLIWWYS